MANISLPYFDNKTSIEDALRRSIPNSLMTPVSLSRPIGSGVLRKAAITEPLPCTALTVATSSLPMAPEAPIMRIRFDYVEACLFGLGCEPPKFLGLQDIGRPKFQVLLTEHFRNFVSLQLRCLYRVEPLHDFTMGVHACKVEWTHSQIISPRGMSCLAVFIEVLCHF